jgi:hypothetical protein
MQPQGAQWKPNPQPSRTNVMDDGVNCGRADEIEEACALIEIDDASTPQVRTNGNLLNIDGTPLFAAFYGTLRGVRWKWNHTPTIFVKEPGLFASIFFADG